MPWTMMRRVTLFVPSTDLSFPTTFSKLPPRRHKILKVIRFMVSGVADDETSFDRCGAFCRRGGNKRCLNGCRNAAAHASQGRCGVADIWGRVRGNFFGRKNEMSAWRRVVIIDMYFLTVASVSSKHKTPPRRPPYAVSCRGVFHGFLR